MSDKYVLKRPCRFVKLNPCDPIEASDMVAGITYKIAAKAVEMREQAIVDEAVRVAKEAGVNELFLMDRQFVIDALVEKMQKRRSVKFVPCVCGYNKHSEWYSCDNHAWFYECLKCGLRSEKYAAKTRTEAKIGWNKMIEELKAGEVHG